jgi:hypothetical protein
MEDKFTLEDYIYVPIEPEMVKSYSNITEKTGNLLTNLTAFIVA